MTKENIVNLKMHTHGKKNMQTVLSNNKEAFALLAVFVALSFIIPYFTIGLLVIVAFLFYKTKNEYGKDDGVPPTKLSVFKANKNKYKKSFVWRIKKEMVLERDFYKCIICNNTENLHVHYLKDYNKIPNEPISSLVTLCPKCHKKQHDKQGYPSTLEEYMSWNVDLVK